MSHLYWHRGKVDRVLFSIDGATQGIYEKYRKNGKLKIIMENVDRLNKFKQSAKSEKPFLHWRYILFNWNDTWDEMKLAIQLAKDHHFDEFTWHITNEPPGAKSTKFISGTKEYSRIAQDVFDGSPRNALLHMDLYRGQSLSGHSIKYKGFIRSIMGKL